MLAVSGIFKNGVVQLEEEVVANRPIKVIITFLEDIEPENNKQLALSNFSFAASRAITNDYKGSFCDALLEERRSDL